jgi:hypothetical protein
MGFVAGSSNLVGPLREFAYTRSMIVTFATPPVRTTTGVARLDAQYLLGMLIPTPLGACHMVGS